MNGWWAALGWTPGPRVLDCLETVTRVINVLVNEARLRRFAGVAVLDRGLECQLALREARGLPRGAFLPRLHQFLPAPDVVAHFQLPADVALARVRARATDIESLEDLTALDAGYRSLPEYSTFTLIDADRPTEEVLRDLLVLAGWNEPSVCSEDRLAQH